MDLSTLDGWRYGCLEGCGFCCTFTPEVAHDELARLRRAHPRLPIVRDGDRMHLGFQGGCGACTLLARRQCQAYGERPAHCRYFPFHVHFGRRAQAVVDHACRGVEADAAPGASLRGAFERDVLAVARADKLVEGEREGRKVYAEFERRAKEAGAWQDPAPAIAAALRAEGPPEPGAWRAALEPYWAEDAVERPFWLTADLRWVTWSANGSRFQAHTMEETGALAPLADAFDALLPEWSPDLEAALQPMLRLAATRDCLEGQVFDLVDAAGYEVLVGDAAALLVRQMRADLALGAVLLRRAGVEPAQLGAELVRFYDARFLDAPTIGGWL